MIANVGLRKDVLSLSLGILLVSTTSACTQQDSAELSQLKLQATAISTLQKQNEDLKKQTSDLQKQVDQLSSSTKALETAQSKPLSLASTPTVSSTTAASCPDGSTAELVKRASEGFTDISGIFGEPEIQALVKLGVIDANTDKFQPHKPISRAEFAEWLVKAHNSYAPFPKIRLAETGPASFPDVSENHQQYKYIQGMVNNGYVIGFDDKTFKPDMQLTREQMIGMKVQFDSQAKLTHNSLADITAGKGPSGCDWADKEAISRRYYDAFTSIKSNDVSRTFGSTHILHPKMPVTRAEAAVCISIFTNGGSKGQSLWYLGGEALEAAKNAKG